MEIYEFHYPGQSAQAHARAAALSVAMLVDDPSKQWNPGYGESHIVTTALLFIACILREVEASAGRYESAFREFEIHRPVEAFWIPAMSVALLGKLERADEARVHIEELEKMKPDFASRARELVGRWMKVDAVVDDLMEGLRTAGLPV